MGAQNYNKENEYYALLWVSWQKAQWAHKMQSYLGLSYFHGFQESCCLYDLKTLLVSGDCLYTIRDK